MKEKVLIVEDDREIGGLFMRILRDSGYRTDQAGDGATALRKLRDVPFDLVILDLMLPVKSGDQVLREIRTFSNLPVIVVSSKDLTGTKIDILRLGADDYITKPFDIDEALARIEAVLRRGAGTATMSRLTCANLEMDLDTKTVKVQGASLTLTPKEYGILEVLMRHPNKVFSKESIFVSVWGTDYMDDDATLNVHMSKLRSKLKSADPKNDYIETLWGMGYRITEGAKIIS
ncbi:MAG: response regulator transcription factor [Clostridiales Family XIII bacterium]|jgi:DNA-binding response OmpR family regulator|nr:response regulator transcription factor [Clostridiales Family XIII bacterium]